MFCALLALSVLCSAQANSSPRLPCAYSGDLLRSANGRVLRYTSDEMKARAVRKVDIAEHIKQFDIKGTAVVDVLVGRDGDALCAVGLHGHPIVRRAVEDALHRWRFTLAKLDGKPVAYVGRMEFTLCNIMCGEQGPSMTILK